MVGKSYLRYAPGPESGVVASTGALTMDAAVLNPQGAPIVAVPALEYVALWNTRTSTLVAKLMPPNARRGRTNEVTSVLLARDPTAARGWFLVAGYASGYVAMWRGRGEDKWDLALYGLSHRPDSLVLSLAVSDDGSRIATGGGDTDITVWDVTSDEPLYRLVGHRGGVVGIAFVPSNRDALVSGSADGLVKLWNLSIQQCVQTIVASDTQVTALRIDSAGLRLFVGVRDEVLKVYNTEALTRPGAMDKDDPIKDHGTLKRKSNKPPTAITFSADKAYVAVVTNRTMEMFKVLTAPEVKKKVQRKRKRRAQQKSKQSNEAAAPAPAAKGSRSEAAAAAGVAPEASTDAPHQQQTRDEDDDDEEFVRTAAEEFVPLRVYHFEEKIRSAAFLPARNAPSGTAALRVAITTAHNTVELHEAPINNSDEFDDDDEAANAKGAPPLGDLKLKVIIDHIAHRNDIRAAIFSANDMNLTTLSADCVRVWGTRQRATLEDNGDDTSKAFEDEQRGGYSAACPTAAQLLSCTATIDALTGVELAGGIVLLPGNNHAVVGTSVGRLLVVSLQSSDVADDISAHPPAPITSIASMADGTVVLSTAKDRRLLRWDVAVLKLADGQKKVTLQLRDEIELAETPLCVRATPNDKLIAVALQDNNVQVLHSDTLRPFLTLFGHKLPVTSIAFSADSMLCATVSMDKSLRFWGMDFGDCHRSIHAHDDYVTDVKFSGLTHYVFTSSMDGSVKHWDGDTWTLIQTVRVHQRGVWALAVNGDGSFVATAGVDRCVRTLMRTEVPIFPDEEEARDAQEAMDDAALKDAAKAKLEHLAAGDVGVGGHRSLATAEAGEALMEALDIVSVECQRIADGSIGDSHPLLRNKTPWQFLWGRIMDVKPSEMRHALSSLTAVHTAALLQFLLLCVEHGVVTSFEVAARVLLGAVKPAPGSNVAVPLAVGDDVAVHQLLGELRASIGLGLQAERDRFGRNTAGLSFLQQSIAAHAKIVFHDKTKIQGAKRKFHDAKLSAPAAAAS